MYPILYKSNETNFVHNGIGFLRDAITVYPEEELNGYSEITIEYDADGFLADEIKNGMIIKAKANDKQQPQLFRIYSHVKDHAADQIVINGRHITNDLADNFVEALEIRNLTTYQAMKAIQEALAYPTRFNFSSTNTTTQSSTNIYRNNPLQMVAGTEGSILQFWGGQIERDNFDLIMHRRRGSDDGVKVLYKKNLTGLQATFDDDSVVTRIYPFKYVEETEEERARLITVPGKYIDSPNIDKYPHIKILPIDASSEEGIENSTDLYNAYKDYFSNEGKDKDLPSISMEVEFEHLHETEEYKDVAALEYVGMGDTITVEHGPWGLDLKASIVKIEYDAIAEKNRKVSAGNVKANFTDSVNQNANDLGVIGDRMNNIDQKSNEAIRAANGKNTIYYGPDEPIGDNLIKGDIWFRIVDGEYTRTYIYDGVQWQLSIDMESKEAKETAAEARNRAEEAVGKADLATSNAIEAINQAQEAFDNAENLSKVVDENTEDISEISQIAQGLQTKVSNAEGDISTVTQLATALQSRMTNAEGSISTLTQTATSLQSTIKSVRDDLDGLEYENRNLVTHNPNYWENGVIFTNGNLGYYTNALRMDNYGVIEPNTEYTITNYTPTSTMLRWREYDANQTINQGEQFNIEPNESVTFKTSSNGYYFKVYFNFDIDVSPRIIGNEAKLKLEKGGKGSNWSPCYDDLATQSQISQLSDNINLRVKENDVINQINISTEDILISGKKLILDGDTTVNGSFRVENANITSLNAGKITGGTFDGGRVNVINVSANSIVGGILQSQNSNTTFNLNSGQLTMRNNAEFILGGGANIQFTSTQNWMYYSNRYVYSGLLFGESLRGEGRPFVGLGTSDNYLSVNDESFNGIRVHSGWVEANAQGVMTNIISRNLWLNDDPNFGGGGWVFENSWNGDRYRSLFGMNTSSFNYNLGLAGARFHTVFADNFSGDNIMFNYPHSGSRLGYIMENTAKSDRNPAFRPQYGGELYYDLGTSYHRWAYIYSQSSLQTPSDKRLKEDINDNILGLDFINDIETVTFRLKPIGNNKEKRSKQFGVVAQDFRGVLEKYNVDINDYEILRIGEDGMYGMQYEQLIAPTIRSVQELNTKVDSKVKNLEEIIEKQALKIADLEQRIHNLEVA